MMPLTGLLITRVGSRRVLAIATTTLCLTLPFVLLASSTLFVAGTLFILGLSNGAMEVAMNAHAVAVEKAWNKPIMSSFHALWSVGGLVGAGVGASAFMLELSPLTHVLIVTASLTLLGSSRAPYLLDASFDIGEGGPTFALPRGPLVGIGLLAFAGLVAEGAVASWGTVYLRNSLGTSTSLAAVGYAMFQGAMVVGRLFGDTLKLWFTEVVLIRLSAALATLGLGGAFFSGTPEASLIGFGFIGLGLSNLVPILFSTAGRAPGVHASVAVVAVATSGYLGYLVGPPLIGLTAEITQLRVALGLVTLLTLFINIFAPTVFRQMRGINSEPSTSGMCQ